MKTLSRLILFICLFLAVVAGAAIATAHAETPLPAAPMSGWCYTTVTLPNYADVHACAVVVQPPVANQLKTSGITYGPYDRTQRQNVNVAEWANIWGHSNATDALNPVWPGNGGAAPVILAFGRNTVLIAHFRTGAVVRPGFFTFARNHSPDIVHDGVDISISTVAGDFRPNGGAARFNALPTDDVAIWWNGAGGNPSFYAVLQPNSDYYLNVRAHFVDPQYGTFPLYLVK